MVLPIKKILLQYKIRIETYEDFNILISSDSNTVGDG